MKANKLLEITKKPFSIATQETFRYFIKNIYPKIPELKNAFVLNLRVHVDFENNRGIIMYKAFVGKKIYYITNNSANPIVVRVDDVKPKEVFCYVKKNNKGRRFQNKPPNKNGGLNAWYFI